MTHLVTQPDTALERAYDVLAEIPAESRWLANYTSENSRDAARRAVGHFIAANGIASSGELYGASQAHVLAWRDRMTAQGYANATVGNRLALLSALYKFLTDQQLCPANPVSGVTRPKSTVNGVGAGKTPRIAKSRVHELLQVPPEDTLQGLRDRALLATYFYTGCRCAEPARLRVRDFRPDGDFWVLEFTVKGGKKNIIPIHQKLQIAIARYLREAGHESERDSPLFRAAKPGRNGGKPINRSQFYRLFKKYAVRVGLPPETSPHWARSTFISDAFDGNADPNNIRGTVGHASLTTTETYNHAKIRPEDSASFAVNY